MVTTELTLGVLLIAFAAYWSYRFKYKVKKLPPGPLGLPFVGYLPFLDATNPHYSLTELAKNFGGIYSVQLGSIFTVVLSDVKLIRQAFAQESFSGRAPLFLTHGIMKGNGIICVQGQKWKEQRKFVVGCLRNFGMVKFGEKRKKMEDDIKVGVDELVEKIKNLKGKPVDIEPLLMHSLGIVVFNLVFGKVWKEEDETWKKLIRLQEEGTKLIGVAGPINFLPVLRFLPKYKKAIEYIESGIAYSHDIYQKILNEYVDNLDENEMKGDEETASSHFLGAFYEQSKKEEKTTNFYTKTQFNYLMADLWGAGVDTTMTTLRWFFLYTAHHSHIQNKIQKEISELIGERDITLSDIPQLHYFQAAMAESQRIRSVTPLGIPHGVLEDSNLNDYYIPKGTMILPLQWAIHMNPELFPDPNTFNPDRFLDSQGCFTKPEAFIPFQTGKRMCLGEEYARMMLYLFAGTVLQNFTFSLEGQANFDGEVGITLTPKTHKIKFFFRKEL